MRSLNPKTVSAAFRTEKGMGSLPLQTCFPCSLPPLSRCVPEQHSSRGASPARSPPTRECLGPRSCTPRHSDRSGMRYSGKGRIFLKCHQMVLMQILDLKQQCVFCYVFPDLFIFICKANIWKDLSFTGVLSKCPQQAEQGKVEAKSQELHTADFQVGGRDPSIWVITCRFPERRISRKLDHKEHRASNLGTRIWDAGVPSGILSTVPKWPLLKLQF